MSQCYILLDYCVTLLWKRSIAWWVLIKFELDVMLFEQITSVACTVGLIIGFMGCRNHCHLSMPRSLPSIVLPEPKRVCYQKLKRSIQVPKRVVSLLGALWDFMSFKFQHLKLNLYWSRLRQTRLWYVAFYNMNPRCQFCITGIGFTPLSASITLYLTGCVHFWYHSWMHRSTSSIFQSIYRRCLLTESLCFCILSLKIMPRTFYFPSLLDLFIDFRLSC